MYMQHLLLLSNLSYIKKDNFRSRNLYFSYSFICFRNMKQLSKCGEELAAVYADILRIDHKLKVVLEHRQNIQTSPNFNKSLLTQK